jgi:hypothetical protein
MSKYIQTAQRIGELVEKKNESYGSAFDKAGEFLKLLFPEGIKPEQYPDMLGLVRVFDKQMRIATSKDAFGESPWSDIAGYGLLGAARTSEGSRSPATTPKSLSYNYTPVPETPDGTLDWRAAPNICTDPNCEVCGGTGTVS